MGTQDIELAGSLRFILRLGVVRLEGLRVTSECEPLRAGMAARTEEFRADLGAQPVSALAEVQRNRRLCHAFGLDPTRDRPQPERLLRSCLRGSLPTPGNSLVDAMNLVSLSLQCPVVAHDLDRIGTPVLARIGLPGESLTGPRGGKLPLTGRPLLADPEGPFGGPGVCLERAAVGLETVRAMVVAWVPADTPGITLERILEEVVATACTYCGGRVADLKVIGRGRAA